MRVVCADLLSDVRAQLLQPPETVPVVQPSMIWPSTMRSKLIPVTLTRLPVGAMPSYTPLCVSSQCPARSYFVAFRDDVLEVDVDVRKGLEQHVPLRFEGVERGPEIGTM